MGSRHCRPAIERRPHSIRTTTAVKVSEARRPELRIRLATRVSHDACDPESMLVNALDYYGTWKLFDGLIDAAFTGKNRQYALGNTPQQRFMGVWSDGVPVKELRVTDKP
jgi:hypothetical protein